MKTYLVEYIEKITHTATVVATDKNEAQAKLYEVLSEDVSVEGVNNIDESSDGLEFVDCTILINTL